MKEETRIVSLISEKVIEEKVKELADRISKDYSKEILVIGILKGAWIFMADLVRRLKIPVRCDFLTLSSYGSSTETSGKVKIVADLTTSVKGKDVLLVEDIVDTGITLDYIKRLLKLREPASLKICALLVKPVRHRVKINIDYLGFTVSDEFVVGYGMDCNEKYRNLPYVGYLGYSGR